MNLRGSVMGSAVAITRLDLTASDLRCRAQRSGSIEAARRMLALALVLEGRPRTEAAQTCGMDRQTLRLGSPLQCRRCCGIVRPQATGRDTEAQARAGGGSGGLGPCRPRSRRGWCCPVAPEGSGSPDRAAVRRRASRAQRRRVAQASGFPPHVGPAPASATGRASP